VAGAIVFALLVQFFINVGMTIGIAPVTGIPLPLISYGGSSLLITLVMVGILESIHVRGRLAGAR
jgi:rod shape determining protein RodA